MKYILILALLAGCALPPETLRGSTIPADAPHGYTKLCREQPLLAVCPQVKP